MFSWLGQTSQLYEYFEGWPIEGSVGLVGCGMS